MAQDGAPAREHEAASRQGRPAADGAGGNGRRHGRLWRALHRVTAEQATLDAEDLQNNVGTAGATLVSRCRERDPVCVAGRVRSVVFRPRSNVPTLEADLYDGTGTVTLLWLGRRRIVGVEPGRMIVARGRLSEDMGRKVIYNPDYELQCTSS